MAGSVQFYGKEQVIDAAIQMECPVWAIFHSGNKIFTKCEETDESVRLAMLDSAFDLLLKNPNDAIYGLKFYKAPKGKEEDFEITEKTPCNVASFNFKTVDPLTRENRQVQYMGQVTNTAYEKRIAELERKLKEQEEEEEPETITGALLDLIKRPSDLAQLVQIGRLALGMPVQNIGAIAGITDRADTAAVHEESKEEKYERIATALDDLEKKVPDLPDHLEMLAAMEEQELQAMIALLKMQKK